MVKKLLVILFLFSCAKENTVEIEVNGKTYLLEQNRNWSIHYKEYTIKKRARILISFDNNYDSNLIYVYVVEKDRCNYDNQELKEGEIDNYEDEEGLEFTPIYKKDKIIINNKAYNRWINNRVNKTISIFIDLKDGQSCLLFSHIYDMRNLKKAREITENDFYNMIGSLHAKL